MQDALPTAGMTEGPLDSSCNTSPRGSHSHDRSPGWKFLHTSVTHKSLTMQLSVTVPIGLFESASVERGSLPGNLEMFCYLKSAKHNVDKPYTNLKEPSKNLAT